MTCDQSPEDHPQDKEQMQTENASRQNGIRISDIKTRARQP